MASSSTKSDMNNLKSDIRRTTQAAGRDARTAVEDAGSSVSHFANKVGSEVRDYVDTVNEDITTAANAITGEIRTNPLRSSLIALGVGVILGVLLRK
jgi:ElaB/YqjD/DUF883 family membrane-anchored ribosome-binding protein